METPNPTEQAFDNAPGEPTVEPLAHERTGERTAPEGGQPQEGEPVDYREKFGHSSAEALRLLEENRLKDAEIARLAALVPTEPAGSSETLYPGFEELNETAQRNLREFGGAIRKQALDEVYKDPAIAFARRNYAENQFETAFEEVATELPQLREASAEFKQKFFNPNAATPSNLKDILRDLGKGFLFDKAHDLGVQEGREQAERIELERANGGQPPEHVKSRTLEEWQRMQQENPAEFAKHAKEYEADASAGKLEE